MREDLGAKSEESGSGKIAPVSVCLMVRNEEANLGRLLRSLRGSVAEICILDTGSTDRTIEIVNEVIEECRNDKACKCEFQIEQYLECNDPETGLMLDFSKGRNRAFGMASQPWKMWLDGDDELCNIELLPDLLQEGQRLHDKSGMPVEIRSVPYETEIDGRVVTSYPRERIFSNFEKENESPAFAWVAPVHEVVMAKRPVISLDATAWAIQHGQTPLRVVHRKVESGKKQLEPHRNLRILEHHFKKQGSLEPRMQFYYARELQFAYRPQEAIVQFEALCAMKNAHEQEVSFALLKLVDLHDQRKEFERAMDCALRLVATAESMPESYFALARVLYCKANEAFVQDENHNVTLAELRDFQRCVFFVELGFRLPQSKKPLFFEPLEREFRIYLYYIRALSMIGRNEDAYREVCRLIKDHPNEPSLQKNKAYFEENFPWAKKESGTGTGAGSGSGKKTIHMEGTPS